jgi:hypothetical protein
MEVRLRAEARARGESISLIEAAAGGLVMARGEARQGIEETRGENSRQGDD